MQHCETCGNQYHGAFEVKIAGQIHVFDCFECAIHALAPQCAHCRCRIIGHGVEYAGLIYCCASCARHDGHSPQRDVIDSTMDA